MEQVKEWIINAPGNFKDFIIANNTNPLLWIVLFFAGILLFSFTYNALHKDK